MGVVHCMSTGHRVRSKGIQWRVARGSTKTLQLPMKLFMTDSFLGFSDPILLWFSFHLFSSSFSISFPSYFSCWTTFKIWSQSSSPLFHLPLEILLNYLSHSHFQVLISIQELFFFVPNPHILLSTEQVHEMSHRDFTLNMSKMYSTTYSQSCPMCSMAPALALALAPKSGRDTQCWFLLL